MVHRFFAPALDPGDETVALPRAEGEHLTRVLRIGVGDTVAVFDGRGHEWLARVVSAVRRDVRVQLVSRATPAAEPHVALTVAQAVLKSDTTVAALMRGARVERWRRVALASVKQSRRAVLPDVRMPLTLDTLLDEPASALRLMLVEPGAAAQAESLSGLQHAPAPGDAMLLVGPEGGWTEQEWASAAAKGVRLVTLGHRTLRADAVPVAAISVLQFLWGDL